MKNLRNKEREAVIKKLLSDNKDKIPDEKVLLSAANKRRGQSVINAVTSRYGNEKVMYKPINDKSEGAAFAYTDGRTIVVNVGNEYFKSEQTLDKKRMVEQGLYSHECGHILFTDFDTMKKTFKSWEDANKILFSCQNYPYFNKSAFKEMNKIFAEYPQLFEAVVLYMQNVFEDAYVEDKIKKLYKGSVTKSINYVVEKLRCDLASCTEYNWRDYSLMVARDCMSDEMYKDYPEYLKIKKINDANLNGFCSFVDRLGRAMSAIFVLWDDIKEELDTAIKAQKAVEKIQEMVGDSLNDIRNNEQKDGMASGKMSPPNAMNGSMEAGKNSKDNNGRENENGNNPKKSDSDSKPTPNQSSSGSSSTENVNDGDKTKENSKTSDESTGDGNSDEDSKSAQDAAKNGSKPLSSNNEESNLTDGESTSNRAKGGSKEKKNDCDDENSDNDEFKGASSGASQEDKNDHDEHSGSGKDSEEDDEKSADGIDESKGSNNSKDPSKQVSHANEYVQRSLFDCMNSSSNSSGAGNNPEDKVTNKPHIVDNGNECNLKNDDEEVEQVSEDEYFKSIQNYSDKISEDKKTDTGDVGSGTSELLRHTLDEMTSNDYNDISKIADKIELSEIESTSLHRGVKAKVCHITEGNRERYLSVSSKEGIEKLSKNLQRKVEKELFERRKGSVKHNLYSGKNLDLKSICNGSNKVFMQNKLPNNKPILAASVLIDQSGSMRGDKMYKATVAAMLLEDFCRNLNIPFSVTGHDVGYCGVELFDYIDFGERNKNARERLVNMASGGCNRDGYAIRYVGNKLAKRKEETKLLFVVSDGLPNDGGYGTKELIADLKDMKKAYKNKGIVIVPICIDASCLNELKLIYGASLVDATDLKKFPVILNTVLEKELKKQLS